MTVKEREKAYKEARAERKAKIKAEPNKHKRFWNTSDYLHAVIGSVELSTMRSSY